MGSGMPLRFEEEKEEIRKIALIQKEILRDILKALDSRKETLHWEWEQAVKLRDNAEKARDLLFDYYKEKVVEIAARDKGIYEAWELVWNRLKELERKIGGKGGDE